MAAVGKWGGRIGYVGNLLGCPYISATPFVHSSVKHVLYLGCFVTAVQGWGVLGGHGGPFAPQRKAGARWGANGPRATIGPRPSWAWIETTS